MTTFDAETVRPAAPSRVREGRCLWLVAAFALGLGGCESSSNLLSSNPAAGPETQLTSQSPSSVAQTQIAKISVAPVIGAPDTVSRDLQTQLLTSLEKRGVKVAKGATDKSEYTLRGYVVAAREKSSVKVSYIWDVTDAGGTRVNRITGEETASKGASKDPWTTVGAPVIQSISEKTAGSIATWIATQTAVPIASSAPGSTGSSDRVATATTPPSSSISAATTGSIGREGPVNAMVPSVTGAPGDGTSSLTAAIQKELTRNGVSLTSQAQGQTYRVEGKVAVGTGKDGKQPIQIDWSVVDPSGKKLGTVSQKNEVPQGSLDGAWGKTADAAASAAAQGILKLLPAQAKATN